jgi:hypothetical protein
MSLQISLVNTRAKVIHEIGHILGRKPIALGQWAEENAKYFRNSGRNPILVAIPSDGISIPAPEAHCRQRGGPDTWRWSPQTTANGTVSAAPSLAALLVCGEAFRTGVDRQASRVSERSERPVRVDHEGPNCAVAGVVRIEEAGVALGCDR